MTPDDNIGRLSREILKQAESESTQVISDAKSKTAQINQRAKEAAELERTRILDQARSDADRIRGQAIATTQLKARTMQLESREKLLTEVFDEVVKKISSIQKRNDYPAIVESIALEAITQLGSKKVVIHADKLTNTLLSESIMKSIRAKFDGTIELGEPLKKGTGIIATTADGHLNYDNTFETRLRRLENELRSPVYRLLMGESL